MKDRVWGIAVCTLCLVSLLGFLSLLMQRQESLHQTVDYAKLQGALGEYKKRLHGHAAEVERLKEIARAHQAQSHSHARQAAELRRMLEPLLHHEKGLRDTRRPYHDMGHAARIRAVDSTAREVLVVYWTPWFDYKNPFEFDSIACANNLTVRVTHDRTKADEAAAFVFHTRGYNAEDLPPRRLDQKWILDTQECPVHDMENGASFIQDFATMRLFDYSMSYHTASDFLHPLWMYDNYTEILLRRSPVPFDQKKGMVFFLASNCQSFNDREAYIKELMKHVEVHSYGSCLNNMQGEKLEQDETIAEMSKYKFYLAFENANCEDYVSEKLANAFRAGVVPVVAGPEDYSSFLPNNHSAINVRDFANPRQLAKFLKRVGSSKELYEQYLSYKDGSGFSDKFRAIWQGRGPFGVYCEMGEELLFRRTPSKSQAGTALLPIFHQCEDKGFMKSQYLQ